MTIAVLLVTNMLVAAMGIILGYVLRILQEKENRRESDKDLEGWEKVEVEN